MSSGVLWQSPYVNIFKQFGVGKWKKCTKEGDVTTTMENLSLAERRRNGLHEIGTMPLDHQLLLDGHSVENLFLSDLSGAQLPNGSVAHPLMLGGLYRGSTAPESQPQTFRAPLISSLHRGSTAPPTFRPPLSASLGGPQKRITAPDSAPQTFQPSQALSSSVDSPARLAGPEIGVQLRSFFVQPYLKQIENKKNLREMAAAAERDYEELEKESEFLASLANNHIIGNIRD